MEDEQGLGEPQNSPHSPEGEAARSKSPSAPARAPSRAPARVPSIPPSAGPSRNYRVLVAALWIGAQAALVITADRRIDGAFGFRMFSESSSIKLALYREVDRPDGRRGRVHVDAGVWTARGADGTVHRLTWYDRVPMPYWVFDQEMHASYGARTQLARLQGALDDLAARMPDDAETRRFLLDVTVRRNGHEPVTHQLASRERTVSPPKEKDAEPTPHDGGP